MLASLNPLAVRKTVKALPQATKALEGLSGIQRTFSSSRSSLNPVKVTNSVNSAIGSLINSNAFTRQHGVDPGRVASRGLAMGMAATAGTIGGGINAASARAQYDLGQKVRKKEKK